MRKIVALLLCAALLLTLLPACEDGVGTAYPTAHPEEPSGTMSQAGRELTARELVDAVFGASGQDAAAVEGLYADEDSERLRTYTDNAYGLEDPWQDGAVVRSTGASALEFAVLRMADEEAAARAVPVLMDYRSAREGDFTGYAPAEADMAADGKVQQRGSYVALFICPDPDGAGEAFDVALSGETPPRQPAVSPGPTEEPKPEPVLELQDLLFRVLVGSACPEWIDVEEKAWTRYPVQGQSITVDGYVIVDDVERKYDIVPSQYEQCVVAWWDQAWLEDAVYELCVFRVEDEDAAATIVDALTSYLEEREARFRADGQDGEADLLHGGRIVQAGRYVALIVSNHAEEAALLFPRAVSSDETRGFFQRFIQEGQPKAPEDPDPEHPDRTRFTPPGKDDMSIYDTSAIRAAWAGGSPEELSRYDRDIYDSAEKVLRNVIEDGMSDLEKEMAIYDWIVQNVDYDWTHQDVLADTPRESYTPYGGLVRHTAVCLGYASTFQLLMDLAGVECITVVGAAFRSEEDHAWNMVRLAGEWYCVDVTWDANGREGGVSEYEWRYFNLTSDEMGRNRQWDYANVPEATATDRGQR